MNILILTAVKMIDPILIVMAIVAGILSRAWWHAVAGALAITAIVEFLLSQMQLTRGVELASLLAGFVAAFAWTALIFWIKQRRAAKKAAAAE
jgi:hypothetical protein